MSTAGLGIMLGLAGSIAINTGNNLQSLGMHKAEIHAHKNKIFEVDSETELSPWSSKTWVFGTTIFILGALLNFASYGFAPQSTLASLESIQFVTNLFLGKLLLKKKITEKMYLGTFLTVGGTVLTVSFSSKEAETVEVVADLVGLWRNKVWIGYIIIIFLFAFLLHIAWVMNKNQKGSENVMAAVYATFSALWGTLSVVFAKLLAQLVEFRADNVDIFAHWFTYVTILAWLLLMVYWLYRLNYALGLYDPIFIIPLLQANFIFFAIVSGGIYFKEFNYMKTIQWVGFVSGIICMFSGIAYLVPQKEEEPETLRGDIAYESSNLKIILTTFMTGAARMNQQAFDIKTRKETYELWLEEAEKKETLSDSESRLAVLLRNYVGGADKTLVREQELRDLLGRKENLGKEESDRAKILMRQLKNFQFKLGEADEEIKWQSERIIRNETKRPYSYSDKVCSRPYSDKVWSFYTNISLTNIEPENVSGFDDESDDPIDVSRENEANGNQTSPPIKVKSTRIKFSDISILNNVEQRINKRFLELPIEMVGTRVALCTTPPKNSSTIVSRGKSRHF